MPSLVRRDRGTETAGPAICHWGVRYIKRPGIKDALLNPPPPFSQYCVDGVLAHHWHNFWGYMYPGCFLTSKVETLSKIAASKRNFLWDVEKLSVTKHTNFLLLLD